MARVFITGVNGFIGSHLAEYLLERGDDVVGLVRSTSDVRNLEQAFRSYGARFRVVVADLRDAVTLDAALPETDYVYHLGAILMGTSEREFRETNVAGTRNLLTAVERKLKGRIRRFLMTSSQAAAGPSATPQPVTESDLARPVSWYGASKRDAEEAVRASERNGVPITIVRPVGVYGERERDISGGTFGAIAMGFAPRIGFRIKIVSMVYVGDLVRGMVAAAESDITSGQTYFLSNPRPYTSTEFVSGIADAMRKKVRIPICVPHFVLFLMAVLSEWTHLFSRARPLITRDKWREVSKRYWPASAAAANRDFGWVAEVPLVDGMERAVDDWRAHAKQVRRVDLEPRRDRALKTFTFALLIGVILELTALIGNWYEFDPQWFMFVAIVGFFGGILGTIAFLAAPRSVVFAFGLGAIAFFAVEIGNHLWFHLWEFAPEPFGRLSPWVRAAVLSIPVGLVPVIIHALIRVMLRLRQRIG